MSRGTVGLRFDSPEALVVMGVCASLVLAALRDGREHVVVVGETNLAAMPEEAAWPPGTRWTRSLAGSSREGVDAALEQSFDGHPAAIVIRLSGRSWSRSETIARLARTLAEADDRRVGVALFVPPYVAQASPPHPLCAGVGLSSCVTDPEPDRVASPSQLVAAGLDALTRRATWRASTQPRR